MDASTGTGFHVAINAHLLSGRAGYRSAGIHHYILNLLRHLKPSDDLRYTVMVGEGELPAEVSLPRARTSWPTGRASVRVLWEQVAQPMTLRRLQADLVHGPAFVGPLAAPCPTVITVHDLSFIRFPRLFRPANRLYLTVMTRLATRRARRLIAVSAHAAAESVRLLAVSPGQVDVVYHGCDPIFHPLPPSVVEEFRRRRGLPSRFVLSVGTLEPRKNHARLVEAFARVVRSDPDLKLVLAGGRGWLYEDLFATVEDLGLKGQVLFPGYVPNSDLPLWYNAATVFAYPSLYEGFGMPVLEAQSCGTPVLTANVSSLPEAAGDGALLVDPFDVESIAAGLRRLLSDESLREELRRRGRAHARQFSWTNTALETARVYRRALSGGGSAREDP